MIVQRLAVRTKMGRELAAVQPRRPRAALHTIGAESLTAGLSLLVCVALLLVVWELVCLAGTFPSIVLPAPLQVAQSFGTELQTGDLLDNTWVTLEEAGCGFAAAALVAGIVGYSVVRLRPLELLLTPFVAASQGIPAVAVAPIILLLLPGTLLPKVVICATVVVFPLLVSTITALRGVGRDYLDVARVFGASRRQTLWHVELPLAAPVLLAGIKLGLTLAITGAVVGEFVASDAGLGFMVNTAINSFDVSTRYVAVITLAALSATLYGLVTLAERMVQQWLAE
jgi:NitT/TauT family transport system permease protein